MWLRQVTQDDTTGNLRVWAHGEVFSNVFDAHHTLQDDSDLLPACRKLTCTVCRHQVLQNIWGFWELWNWFVQE